MRGRIQRALSGFYYVKCADGQLYTCKARGKFRREGISPLVGDDVEFCEVPGGEGRIDEILPRRNSFDRPSVANIDQTRPTRKPHRRRPRRRRSCRRW